MDINAFEPDAYLGRIDHPDSVSISADGLASLHRAQVGTIAFENFDILLGRGISLETAVLFNKLVRSSRGGYCFELNALFLTALRFFGFDARPLLARVHVSGAPSGRGHQMSVVTVGERQWISDVGFGSPHLPAPLPLEIGRTAALDGAMFRLIDAGPLGGMLQTMENRAWRDLYSFDLGHVCPGDIACGNHFTSTHPGSFFTFTRVAALPIPDGRVTLCNRTLRTIRAGTEQVCEIAEGEAYLDALKTYFGIELDAPYEALPSIPIQKEEDRPVTF